MKLKLDNRGVSLAMTIGLLMLLVTLTATINELVVRALRASHQIEAADKAYLAAEAGVEDALYELSIHNAGYETAGLDDPTVRNDNFDNTLKWNNEWQISGRDTASCDDMAPWQNAYTPTLCGRVYEGQKHVISLFTDDALSTGITTDEINEAGSEINVLSYVSMKIRFRIPIDVYDASIGAFNAVPTKPLLIDNDKDYDPDGSGLNEDGAKLSLFPLVTCDYSGAVEVSDNDCDGHEDEDSHQDPVFLWQLVDNAGHFWKPLIGCKLEANDPSHGFPNSLICESTFRLNGQEVHASIDHTDLGIDQNGTRIALWQFINTYAGTDNLLQLEIVPVAPFEAIDPTATGIEPDRIPFTNFEYGIDYSATGSMSSAHFAIRSDGYYQDFKQSITTNVTPRAGTRLLDLTIIQQ